MSTADGAERGADEPPIRRSTATPRSLLSNTIAGAIALGWITLVTFAATPILLRELGPSEYGAWVLLTVVLIQGRGLASLLDLGLQQSLIQRIADTDDLDEAARRLGAGLRVLTGVGLAAGAALALAAPAIVEVFDFTPGTVTAATAALRILALQLVIDLPGLGFASALEGVRRYEARRALDAARAALFLGAAVWAVTGGGGLEALAWSSLGSAAAFAVACAVLVVRGGLRPTGHGSLRTEVRRGLPFMALRVTGVTFRQLDKIVLGLLVSTVAVAGFDVADKANLAPLTILGVATSALIPAAAARRLVDWRATQGLVAGATRWSCLLAMPVAGLVAAVAPAVAQLIAGEDIAGTAAAMRWLLVSTVVAALAAAGFEMALGIGGARRLAPISIAGFVLNVVATVAMAHAYGLPGAAAASCLAVAFEVPLQVWVIASLFEVRARQILVAAAPGLVLAAAAFVPAFVLVGDRTDSGAIAVGALVGGACVAAVGCLGLVRLPGHDRSLLTRWRQEPLA